jgi:hypothetical protein
LEEVVSEVSGSDSGVEPEQPESIVEPEIFYSAVSPVIRPEEPIEVPGLDIGGKENGPDSNMPKVAVSHTARDSGCDPMPQDAGVQACASEEPADSKPTGRGDGGTRGDDPVPAILECLDEIAPRGKKDRRKITWKTLQHFCGRVITYDKRRYVVENVTIIDNPEDIAQDDLARLMAAVDEEAVPAQLVNFRLRPAHWAGFIFRDAYSTNVVIEMQILSLLYSRGQLAFSTPELAQASLTRLTQKASRFVPLSDELMLAGQQAYLQTILMSLALLNREYHGYRLNWLALAFGNTGDTLRGGVLEHPANVEYSLGYLMTRILIHYEREILVLALAGGLTLGLVGVGIGLARIRATLVTSSAACSAGLLRLMSKKTPPPTLASRILSNVRSLSFSRVWMKATQPIPATEAWLWSSE